MRLTSKSEKWGGVGREPVNSQTQGREIGSQSLWVWKWVFGRGEPRWSWRSKLECFQFHIVACVCHVCQKPVLSLRVLCAQGTCWAHSPTHSRLCGCCDPAALSSLGKNLVRSHPESSELGSCCSSCHCWGLHVTWPETSVRVGGDLGWIDGSWGWGVGTETGWGHNQVGWLRVQKGQASGCWDTPAWSTLWIINY